MDYCGEFSLKSLFHFENKVSEIMFNVFFISYTLFSNYKMNHSDLHRGNIVFKKVKPFQKTYYIGKYKYLIKNQTLKICIIDFGNLKKSNDPFYDIQYINMCIDRKFRYKIQKNETCEEFFKRNFYMYLK